MSLNFKFNLLIITLFVIGMFATAVICDKILHRNVEKEIQQMAEIIMENAKAVRSYTVEEVKPLLVDKMHEKFLPQSVPAYAAAQIIERVRARFPEYSYKEATLNPINPNSRATDWETSIIEYFRNNTEQNTLIGTNNMAVKPYLYVAHPLRVSKDACLSCHGDKGLAPKTMLDHYQPTGGFGWKKDEIVGVQIVNVPIDIALQRSREVLFTFIVSIGLVFFVMLVLINIFLYYMVTKPITHISSVANQISLGNTDAPEFEFVGNNEFNTLGDSFNRMRRSLTQAMKMLEEN